MTNLAAVPPLPLCQVAFSVADLEGVSSWYRDVFGFLPAGGTRFRGAAVAALQGLPGASSRARWLVDRQEFFQLELFHFEEPAPRHFARQRSLVDIGYAMVGIHVGDFDRVLERLHATGAPVLDTVGAAGRRRAAARDPEGVYLEVMEDDPRPPGAPAHARPAASAAVSFVRASVPDLERSVSFFVDVIGLSRLPEPLIHRPSDEALWGLEGGLFRSAELAGGGCVLELVQYVQPPGRPWPSGYRISDRGLLNVAFGGRSRPAYEAAVARVRGAGVPMNAEMSLDVASVVYVEDGQGFSVELLCLEAGSERLAGFEPRPWKGAGTGTGQPSGR